MYKLASSRPAQAVGTSDNCRRTDGDGRRTAGTPLVGVEATSANSSQPCETLPPIASTSVLSAPMVSQCSCLHSPPTAALQSGPASGVGASHIGSDSVAATHVPLKPRSFRIATWNMNGQSDSTNIPKIHRALDIMSLERVDLLALTETHHDNASPISPHGCSLLAHSGISTSHAASGWTSLFNVTLIPGYAVLALLSHRHSTESFWFLCVYANIRSSSEQGRFYPSLKTALTDFVSSYPELAASSPSMPATWSGCIATGDWNMVEHVNDRSPPSLCPAHTLVSFQDIISLCCASDVTGPDAFPCGFTHSSFCSGHPSRARLDHIYVPVNSWSADLPVAFPTHWSDHKFVYADCVITHPCVEIAWAAPRLPPLSTLNTNKTFWPRVMSSYASLASGPITLERWTDFKSFVLCLGSYAKVSHQQSHTAEWRAALHGDLVDPNNIQEAICHALYPPSSHPPPCLCGCRWCSAIPNKDLPRPVRVSHLPPKTTRWREATDPSPRPSISWSNPWVTNVFDIPQPPSDPVGPWFPAFVPAPQ